MRMRFTDGPRAGQLIDTTPAMTRKLVVAGRAEPAPNDVVIPSDWDRNVPGRILDVRKLAALLSDEPKDPADIIRAELARRRQ